MKLSEIKKSYNQDSEKWLWLIAKIVGVVLFLVLFFKVIKNMLVSIGLLKDPGIQAKETDASTAQIKIVKVARDEVLKQYQAQVPTKTDKEWLSIADTIHNDLMHSSISNNVEDAGYQVCRVQNLSDVYKLIDSYGNRWKFWFGIPMGTYSLPEIINSELSKDKIAVINDNYSRKGINYQF